MPLWKKMSVWILTSLAIILVLEVSLRLMGEKHISELKSSPEAAAAGDESEVRILFLGESTTAWGMTNSYPAVLGRLIEDAFPDRKVRIINEGIPATDTSKILANLDALYEKHRPNIVLTMMGVNDFWAITEREETPLERWLKNFRIYKIADQIKARLIRKKKVEIEPSSAPPKVYPISQLSPGESRALSAAQRALSANEPQEAEQRISGCWKDMRRAPPQCLALAGKIALRLNKETKALRLFDLCARKSTNPDEIYDFASEYVRNFGAGKPAHIEIIRKYAEAALRLDPNHALSNWAMGCLVEQSEKGNEEKGIRYLRKAAEAGLVRGDLYVCLGDLQLQTGDLAGAVESWKKGSAINDVNRVHLYSRLIQTLLEHGQVEQSREYLREAEQALPGNSALLEIRRASAGKLGPIVTEATFNYKNFMEFPPTRRNYRSIVTRLLSKNVAVVAVQYPNTTAQPLREILSGLPVPIVSNEQNFAQALQKHSFDALFVDRFAESFGHFSPLGSRLVAEAALQTLVKAGVLR